MSDCLSFSKILRHAEQAEPVSAVEADHLRDCPRCRSRLQMASDDHLLEQHLRLAGDQIRDFAMTGDPVIGNYRLLKEIGRGGMGVVYEALQQNLNRKVALKILPALLNSLRPESAERFRAEAAAVARLQHPNIVPIYDYGRQGGCHYYAMELIEGHSLSEIIRSAGNRDQDDPGVEGDIPAWTADAPRPQRKYFRRIAEWMSEVADALQFAHDRGVIHRDIKPSNLIMCHSGRIMISDFGLAKDLNDEPLTRTENLMGTWRYMSPEQVRGGRVDHRTDVYSLGVTLYEWLTLRPVWSSVSDYDMPRKVLEYEPPSADKVSTGVPRELAVICSKAMSKTVRQRYQSAGELGADLRRFLDDEPIRARQPGLPTRVIKYLRRNRSVVGLAVLGLLLATSVFSTAAYLDLARERTELRSAAVAELVTLARTHLDEGRFNVAASVYSNALSRDPGLAYVYASRAVAYSALHRYSRAVDDLSSAIELTPQRPGPYFWRGVLHIIQGHDSAADADFEKAVTLNPNYQEARVFAYFTAKRGAAPPPDDQVLISLPDASGPQGSGMTARELLRHAEPPPVLATSLRAPRLRALLYLIYAEQAMLDGQMRRAARLYAQSMAADDRPGIVRQYAQWRFEQASDAEQ